MMKKILSACPDLKESLLLLLLFVAGQAAASLLYALPMYLTYLIAYIPPLVYLYIMGARRPGRSDVEQSSGLRPGRQAAAVAVAVPVELAVIVLAGAATSWIETPQWYTELFRSMMQTGLLSTAVTVCVLAPVMEEFLFRRIVLCSLARKMSGWKALLLSSLMFAAAHFNLWQALPAFILGCLLGWICLRTGNWWASVLLHALNNSLTIAVSVFFGPDVALTPLSQVMTPGLYYLLVILSAVVAAAGIWLIYRITRTTIQS